MTGLEGLIAQFGWPTLAAIAVAALVTSSIHGAIGVAGGLLMTAILALLIGVRPSVPVMSVALTISHASRSLMHVQVLNRQAFLIVMTSAFPFIVMTGFIYAMLPVNVLALVLAVIVFTAIPMRHWARACEIEAGPRILGTAGAVYGFFAGASIGAASVLSPFLLGFGLAKEAFVGTMAAISFSTNVVRIGAFSGAELMTSQYLLLGLLVGIIMIPGNYIGRVMLRWLTVVRHGQLVDALAALGALNFLYLAYRA